MSNNTVNLTTLCFLLFFTACTTTTHPEADKKIDEPPVVEIIKIQKLKFNQATKAVNGIEYLLHQRTYQLVSYGSYREKTRIIDSGFILKNAREFSGAIFSDFFFNNDGSILLLVDFSAPSGKNPARHLYGYVIKNNNILTIKELPPELHQSVQSPYDRNLFLHHAREDGSLLLINLETGAKNRLWFSLLNKNTSTVHWGTKKNELLFRNKEYLYLYKYLKSNGKRIRLPEKLHDCHVVSMKLSSDNNILFANIEYGKTNGIESGLYSCFIDLHKCVVYFNSHTPSLFADFANGSSQFIFYQKGVPVGEASDTHVIVDRDAYKTENMTQCEYEDFWMSQ
jgi:hypothetical protein